MVITNEVYSFKNRFTMKYHEGLGIGMVTKKYYYIYC